MWTQENYPKLIHETLKSPGEVLKFAEANGGEILSLGYLNSSIYWGTLEPKAQPISRSTKSLEIKSDFCLKKKKKHTRERGLHRRSMLD